jgi:hypothetical protein
MARLISTVVGGSLQGSASLTTHDAAMSHTAPPTSLPRPAIVFSAAWVMKPRPTPVAMEKANGMASAVTMAGTQSVASSQSAPVQRLRHQAGAEHQCRRRGEARDGRGERREEQRQ